MSTSSHLFSLKKSLIPSQFLSFLLIFENPDRQLNQIVFLRNHLGSSTTVEKMKYTLLIQISIPLTNSASESRMAHLDVKVKLSGGGKQVISVNQYFSTEECSDSNILQIFK